MLLPLGRASVGNLREDMGLATLSSEADLRKSSESSGNIVVCHWKKAELKWPAGDLLWQPVHDPGQLPRRSFGTAW